MDKYKEIEVILLSECNHSIINSKCSAINDSTLSYHNEQYHEPKF